ncbi:hypothetical protein [Chryseobacterium oranimense]|uniref:hypothetical protein n=1 Tax=Chryseobacterium oranimense TaxID=421058 RepID=UPI0031D3632C
MGGFIELYKIDKTKIKERLYPKLSDTALPEIYNSNLNTSFGTFQNYLINNKNSLDYLNTSYETILKKLQTEKFTLEHNEFSAIFDWFTWYYQDKHQGDEIIFAEHGLIAIGNLNVRYEVPIFFALTDDGIRDFYLPLLNPTDFKWYNDSSYLNTQKVRLMIDYLVVLCFNIAGYKKDPCQQDIKENFIISDSRNDPNMQISTWKHLESYLNGNRNNRSTMEHLFEDGYTYIPGIVLDIKRNLGSYQGLIYKDNSY